MPRDRGQGVRVRTPPLTPARSDWRGWLTSRRDVCPRNGFDSHCRAAQPSAGVACSVSEQIIESENHRIIWVGRDL